MKRLLTVLIAAALLAAATCSYAFAQAYQPVPKGLHEFLGQIRNLSEARDAFGLEKCILPYLGMRAYGNTITRMDLSHARNMDHEREFQFSSEGVTEVQTLLLSSFLFGELRCFGLLGSLPFTKGILITEAQRWDDDMPAYYEREGCDYLAYPMEEYQDGDIIYGVNFSPWESQRAVIGHINGKWYLLAISAYE